MVDLPVVLGVVSGLSVTVPGIVLLSRFGRARLAPLRNLTAILASFSILHGLYHFSLLAGLNDVGSVLDFLTSVILVVLALYYTQRVVGAGLSLFAFSDVSGVLRNLVPVMLVLAFLLFARLAVRSRSATSLQSQLSAFIMVWIVAELLRALLDVGVIAATPALQLLGFEIHTVAMVAFGAFLLLRFYRVAVRSSTLPPDWMEEGRERKKTDSS